MLSLPHLLSCLWLVHGQQNSMSTGEKDLFTADSFDITNLANESPFSERKSLFPNRLKYRLMMLSAESLIKDHLLQYTGNRTATDALDDVMIGSRSDQQMFSHARRDPLLSVPACLPPSPPFLPNQATSSVAVALLLMSATTFGLGCQEKGHDVHFHNSMDTDQEQPAAEGLFKRAACAAKQRDVRVLVFFCML